jgi:hypothetical protein
MIYGCRDCRTYFGIIQWLCQICFFERDDNNLLHKREHEFAKCEIKYDPNLPDDHKDTYYCQICHRCSPPFLSPAAAGCLIIILTNLGLPEGEQVEHKHIENKAANSMTLYDAHQAPDYFMILGPKKIDELRLYNYRTCDKILCINSSVQYSDKVERKCVQCQFCEYSLRSGHVYFLLN